MRFKRLEAYLSLRHCPASWGRRAYQAEGPSPVIPRGFTLIEMLLVVALLGVLVAIGLPTYSSYVDRARVGQAIGDIKTIELLIERFNTVNFRLPASLGEIGEAVPTDPWDRA